MVVTLRGLLSIARLLAKLLNSGLGSLVERLFVRDLLKVLFPVRLETINKFGY